MENNRVLSIEAVRFLIMFVVVVWHFKACMGFMHHGYLAVDFFFILSGVFLYRSATKTNSKGALDYTCDKVIRFYPEIFIVLIPCLVATWPRVLTEPERLLNDLFFVSSSGVFGSGWNAPLWFLHVMILAGGLLYPLVKKFTSIALTCVLPVVFLLGMTWILNSNEGSLEITGIRGPFDMPTIRGLSDMSLGILVGAFWRKKGVTIADDRIGRKIIDVMSVLSFAAFLVNVKK